MNRPFISVEERIRSLSEIKAKALALLLEQKSKAKEQQTIRPYPRPNSDAVVRVPASWAQQRLWFVDQLEGQSVAYNIPVALRLRGALDLNALRKALETLVQRHEVLRTVFVSAGGELWQEIAAAGRFALEVINLTESAPAERDAQVRAQESEEAQGRFDLHVGPLIRGRLLRLQTDEHILLITIHHIISDGWSIGVMSRELGELYKAYLLRHADPLPRLPIQYGDYAQWQRQWLRGEVLERQLNYWRSSLSGTAPSFELPSDRARPPVQSYRGDSVQVALGAPLCAELRAFAQRHDMTLFMVLYAAWAILLSRLGGQEDVVIGTPIANRQLPEVEGLIGFFVNTLVLRIAARGDARIVEFLESIKEVTLKAYDHQDVPFERVVEALQPQRSVDRNPLFQVMFALQNAPRTDPQLFGLLATWKDGLEQTSMFDLLLSLEERGDKIVGTLNYATDLFDRDTIERWTEYFMVLLRDLTGEYHTRVSDVSILPEKERRQIIESLNATQADYPRQALVYELFEEQARCRPDAIAVVYQERCLTYGELNAKANQLARYLSEHGVGPDQPVGICIERSIEMVMGLLGVSKAGGAYLPLDPNYPSERLKYMIEDAAPQVVLTQDTLRGQLPPTEAVVTALDTYRNEIAAYSDENLPAETRSVTSQNLVYVIYTSGTTGRPKGTAMAHGSMVNLIEWHRSSFEASGGKRVLQFAALSFDVAFQEIFSTLCTGGLLVLLDEWIRRDARALAQHLISHSVERLFVPPLMLQVLAECCEAPSAVPGNLEDVITAGEQLRVTPEISRLFRRLNGCRLHNHYGPTETHVVTALCLGGNPEGWPTLPAIGRPISNTQIYVLGSARKPVPMGVAGEIYIGGSGLARGYRGRPELTAERFVTDPFSVDQKARLYKTGDRGRWQANGTLEYLGRNDDQVKIRGHRIELGEIEAQLEQHLQMKEVAVTVREDVPGERRLVAYFTLRGDSGPNAEELRTYLKSVLPEHMVPSAYVMLANLPLTPSGKLDRRALPAPNLSAYTSREYQAPEGRTEEILAGTWQELLRVDRVGRQDNFFQLGGHSLLIVQMMEHLRRVGFSVNLRSVYESETLAELANAVTRDEVEKVEVPPNLIPVTCYDAITPQMLPLVELTVQQIERLTQLVPGGAKNIQDIYPLAPLQEGILFHHLISQHGDTYVVTLLLSVGSRENLDKLVEALQKVIDRHDVLRSAVAWEQLPQPVQVIYRHATLPVEELQLDPEREVVQQLKERMAPEWQKLDLHKAPLIRLQVASDADESNWHALLQLHHLICDHESLDVMLAEVMAYVAGRAQGLPEPVPYRNHVAQALTRAQTYYARDFFRSKLGDVDEPTAPFGLLNVYGDGSLINESYEQLSLTIARRIRIQAGRLGVSAATLFHAAWALVVAHTCGRDDVVFGTVLLGRMQGSAGAQHTLGMFMNTLPLRLRLKNISARELVGHSQRELLELLNYEQASLAEAQRCSGIEGTAPLFTALLNYRWSTLNLDSELASAGLRLVAAQSRTNYPVTLGVMDLGESFALEMETDRRIDAHRMIGYMTAALQSLVEALEVAPQARALSLSILPASERHQVLELFNATHAGYSKEKLIHELFEEQVERTPQAVAVVCGGQSLTYGDLNSRANQLARYLSKKGVGPDQLVGLCIQRSLEMVVALLGILKAGGAYVPLDPGYPTERLTYMLNDAAPKAMITQEQLRERMSRVGTEVIALDQQWSEIAQQPVTNLDARTLGLRSHHLAYVIYTSGSTGKPKGVAIEHRNTVNLICWAQSATDRRVFDQTLQSTSLNFDLSVYECFVPIATGGSIRVVHNALTLAKEPVEVTLLNTVPSAIESMLDGGYIPKTVRVVNLAGEVLKKELVDSLFARTPVERVCNLYGPSETTTYSSWVQIVREHGFNSTIGCPIANTQIYILDRHLQSVPIGVAGEIYIGGAGVARGYLNRAGLTAERFVADPFSPNWGRRMYKTGDLGRWRTDGAIEYLGRNDHQVKIRGFRIELGEIETHLARNEQVKDAVVTAREDVPGEKRLVAYVIAAEATITPNVEELRTHLRAILPEYMVPSAFLLLDQMPLTANGKVDFGALPAPELGAYVTRAHEAPEGEVEEVLAGIWRGLLSTNLIGRRDNFFELGGHSLLATRVISRIVESLDVELPIQALFDAPTIQELGVCVEEKMLEGHRLAPLHP